MADCTTHAAKYIMPHVCRGPESYPRTFVEFYNIMNKIGDNWDQQIACVLMGQKKLAMTDYEQFQEDKYELEYYYQRFPKDEKLRETALNCGVQRIYGKTGTTYWFKEPYRKNAEILSKIQDGQLFIPEDLHSIVRSLLLGYSEPSIILYELYDQLAHYVDEKVGLGDLSQLGKHDIDELEQIYKVNLDNFIDGYGPIIDQANQWIFKHGGK